MNKIKKAWRNKWKILEGLWYNHVVFLFNKKHWAAYEVEQRRAICAKCPLLDKEGKGENVLLPGLPSCGVCGCNIKELTACLSCECSYEDDPKWFALEREE